MAILGPKLRGDLGRVKAYFDSDDVDGADIQAAVEADGTYTISFDDKEAIFGYATQAYDANNTSWAGKIYFA